MGPILAEISRLTLAKTWWVLLPILGFCMITYYYYYLLLANSAQIKKNKRLISLKLGRRIAMDSNMCLLRFDIWRICIYKDTNHFQCIFKAHFPNATCEQLLAFNT